MRGEAVKTYSIHFHEPFGVRLRAWTTRVRWWLILKLAGTRTVVLNATIEGLLVLDASNPALFCHNFVRSGFDKVKP